MTAKNIFGVCWIGLYAFHVRQAISATHAGCVRRAVLLDTAARALQGSQQAYYPQGNREVAGIRVFCIMWKVCNGHVASHQCDTTSLVSSATVTRNVREQYIIVRAQDEITTNICIFISFLRHPGSTDKLGPNKLRNQRTSSRAAYSAPWLWITSGNYVSDLTEPGGSVGQVTRKPTCRRVSEHRKSFANGPSNPQAPLGFYKKLLMVI